MDVQGEGGAVGFCQSADLQLAKGTSADSQNQGAHGAVSHVVFCREEDDGALHDAETGVAKTREYEQGDGGWEDIGEGEGEQH